MPTLVLVRHGESEWNKANLFTGWVDVELSDKGREEAAAAGKALKDGGYTFDIAFTSYLKRAQHTLDAVVTALDLQAMPVVKTWRLNERMYGALTGLDKKETVERHGAEQVQIWRRSFDIPPPPIDEGSEHYPGKDPMYKDLAPEDVPKTECLKDTIARCLPFWSTEIEGALKAGKRVIVAAHGNSIRAICKHLDNIPEDVIPGLEIPTGIPLVYNLNDELKPVPHPDRVAPLNAAFIGDPEVVAQAQAKVANQTKK